jgi:steroid delta-isomerase
MTAMIAMHRFFDAIAAVAPSRIAATFAEDGEIEDPVGSPAVRGRAAIETSFTNGFATRIASAEIHVIAAFTTGSSVAAHWRMRARGVSGREAEVEGIDVIHVDASGLIMRVEGYWDPAPFLAAVSSGG